MKACAKILFGIFYLVLAIFLLLSALSGLLGEAGLVLLVLSAVFALAGIMMGVSGYIASQKEP